MSIHDRLKKLEKLLPPGRPGDARPMPKTVAGVILGLMTGTLRTSDITTAIAAGQCVEVMVAVFAYAGALGSSGSEPDPGLAAFEDKEFPGLSPEQRDTLRQWVRENLHATVREDQATPGPSRTAHDESTTPPSEN